MLTESEKEVLYQLLASYPLSIRERGLEVYLAQKVFLDEADAENAYYRFLVEGSNYAEYEVEIWLKKAGRKQPLALCDCPYLEACKHEVACLLFLEVFLLEEEGEDPARPGSPGSRSFSGHFTRVENYPQLDSKKLHQMVPSRVLSSPFVKGLQYWEKDGLLTVYLGFSQRNWGQLSWEKLELRRIDRNLEISCCCQSHSDTLCAYAYRLLDFFLKKEPAFFQPDYASWLAKEASGALAPFGLEQVESWSQYMLRMWGDNEFYFRLRPKYESLFTPVIMHDDKLAQLTQQSPAAELPQLREQENFYLGFCFDFYLQGYGVNLWTLRGAANDPEAAFKNKLRLLSHQKEDALAQRRPEDAEIEGAWSLTYGLRHQGLYPGDWPDFISQMEGISTALSAHPRLYLHRGEHRLSAKTLRQKDLMRVRFSIALPRIEVVFKEEEGLISASPRVWSDGQWYYAGDPEMELLHPLFLLCKDQLFLLPSAQRGHLLEALLAQEKILMAPAKFQERLSDWWLPLSKYCQLDFSSLSAFSIPQPKLKALKKELYLSELGQYIIFKPMVLYQSEHRVELLQAASELRQDEQGKFSMPERDMDFEQAYLDELRALHPDLATQNRPDFWYLTSKSFLKERWFLKAFAQLTEAEVSVFGWESLDLKDISPYPPKIKYQVNHQQNWFETELEFQFGEEKFALDSLKKHLNPEGFVQLSNGKKGLLPEQWLERVKALFNHGKLKGKQLHLPDQLFGMVDLLFDQLEDESTQEFIAQRKQKLLDFKQIQSQPVPAKIKATLRHYQEDGFNWLCFLDEFKWGGILADDMGLGKTLQVITFLSYIIEKEKTCNLVVLPTSLLFNWEAELKKFAPHLSCYFHYGSERGDSTAVFDDHDLVITTYGLMVRDLALFKDYQFNYLILDESQAIKNPASQRYKAARVLKAHNRLALTGTPIENNTFDLYAQMSFLNPGLLGSAAAFKKTYAQAIDSHGDQKQAQALQNIIRPFVLRRTKEQVATELPDKVEDFLFCEMPSSQRKIYENLRQQYYTAISDKMAESGLAKSRFSVLEGLTKLRQVCDSPKLIPAQAAYSGASAKLDLLVQHINEKTGQHKILVFSQFVKMLDLIRAELDAGGIPFAYLDGKSSREQREQNVQRFQSDSDCRVFLISLKAGGTGLNLTAADYVYLVDPWWNPAVENQAIDRCYRIGQEKKVIAYRMICKGTVEEKISDLQKRKMAVATELIHTDENLLKKLDGGDILNLFSN